MRSTLTFCARLGTEPVEKDDLLRMQVTRAIVASVTGQEVLGGLTSSSAFREIFYPVHVDRIPQAWLDAAESLVRQGLLSSYRWQGEIEPPTNERESMTVEVVREGKRYTGILYRDEE